MKSILFMSKFNPNKIISDYQAAYQAANNQPIDVEHKGQGWFHLSQGGFHRDIFRTKEILKATGVLATRAIKKNQIV